MLQRLTRLSRPRVLLVAVPLLAALGLLAAPAPHTPTPSTTVQAFAPGGPRMHRYPGDDHPVIAFRTVNAPPVAPDGRRLLAELAVAGGLVGLLWPAGRGPTPPATSPAAPLEAAELERLREELDRLQATQREFRLNLDWQQRLLSDIDPHKSDSREAQQRNQPPL